MSKHRLPFLPAACVVAALLSSVVLLSGCGNKDAGDSATTTAPGTPPATGQRPSSGGGQRPAYARGTPSKAEGTSVSELEKAAGNPSLSAEDKQKIQNQIRAQQGGK